MKIGMTAVGIGKAARPSTIRAVVESAERLGFATLWAPEHVVLFDSHDSKYPYRDDGSFMARSNIDLLDPFIGLTYAAAFSHRIRLATGICLVAEHNPLALAKVIASLDSLSSGRFALGVGIGWSSEEFAALGIPFERRAQRTCEYIEVMRKLWGEEKSSFAGEFVRFDGVRSYPEQAAAKLGTLRKLMSDAGRDMKELEIIISPYENEVSVEDLHAYHELGVDEFVPFVRLPGDDARIPEALERVARQWVEPAMKLQ